MKGVLKCLEVGVLLTENDEEFEDYNQVYKRNGEDSKYGYNFQQQENSQACLWDELLADFLLLK